MAKGPTGNKLEPVGMAGVYVVSPTDLARCAPDGRINGRPIRAWAPHPEHDELIYVTTEHPETLAFLPEPYIEVD
jgi:hypothetical protein